MPGAAAGGVYLKCGTCEAIMFVISSRMSPFTLHVPLTAVVFNCVSFLSVQAKFASLSVHQSMAATVECSSAAKEVICHY